MSVVISTLGVGSINVNNGGADGLDPHCSQLISERGLTPGASPSGAFGLRLFAKLTGEYPKLTCILGNASVQIPGLTDYIRSNIIDGGEKFIQIRGVKGAEVRNSFVSLVH